VRAIKRIVAPKGMGDRDSGMERVFLIIRRDRRYIIGVK
jgi:hypothetical protein